MVLNATDLVFLPSLSSDIIMQSSASKLDTRGYVYIMAIFLVFLKIFLLFMHIIAIYRFLLFFTTSYLRYIVTFATYYTTYKATVTLIIRNIEL